MPHELLTNAQMATADRLTIDSGIAGIELMEKAGKAVADIVSAHYQDRPVFILCGPGNNGGDGFVAARYLTQNGFDVQVASLVEVNDLRGDAAQAAAIWESEPIAFEAVMMPQNCVVVDAVFGTGFNGILKDPVARLFQEIRNIGCPVVAVDIPSGVEGDTGVSDLHTLQADYSVTFFRKKLGHVLYPGAELCGEVSVHDIGIPDSVLSDTDFVAIENSPDLWKEQLPHADPDAHKYKKGHAVMMGGSEMTGAIRLASEAAMRVGTGLCSIVAPPETGEIYRKGAAHIIVEDGRGYEEFVDHCQDERRNAILIGPGAGLKDKDVLQKDVLQKVVLDVVSLNKPCVLDADSLSVFKEKQNILLKNLHSGCVLTPHEGEFKRLFGDIKGSKLERAKQAAGRAGCTVLLKGPDTIIAAPDRIPVIDSIAVPELGTAGSGDVLAGMITGYLAQGVDAFDAACMAVWIHAQAGLCFGSGLVASDIPDMIPPVLKDLTKS